MQWSRWFWWSWQTPIKRMRGPGSDPSAVIQAVRLQLSSWEAALRLSELEVEKSSEIVQLVFLPVQVCLQRHFLGFCPDSFKKALKSGIPPSHCSEYLIARRPLLVSFP